MPRANVQRDRPVLGYLLLFVDHSTPIVRRRLYGNRYAWYQIRYNRRAFFRRAKHRKWIDSSDFLPQATEQAVDSRRVDT